MKPIRVAIVGCGRISDLHEMGYRGREDARIVAVCDTKRKNARAKAKAWSVDRTHESDHECQAPNPRDGGLSSQAPSPRPGGLSSQAPGPRPGGLSSQAPSPRPGGLSVYPDYQRLLADPEVDLVELLVPHHLHAEMTVAACEAGKHVSVQKPMALSVAEANRMIAAAEKAGVVLRIFENFVFYPPHVRAKQMIEAGEIGEPQMIRLHVNTGTQDAAWKVPLSAWMWRFDEARCGGGPLVFDHGYHLFSLARYLMGEVERVYAWIDRSPVVPTRYLDAPAVIVFQFKSPRRYGVLDFAHTPHMRIESLYYADDDRVEVIGDRGILFINRCTARTVDLPALMMFRDGKTTPIPVERVEWHDSFIDCTRHLIGVLQEGGQPVLDGPTGKAVLQFTLAALTSARTGQEVRPDEVE